MSLKKVLPVIISFVFFIICLIYMQVNMKDANEQLQAKLSEKYQLKNEYDVKKSTVANTKKKLIQDATGLDTNRVAIDKDIAEKFAYKVFTWGNGQEYDEVRNMLLNMYGLSQDSDFMTSFYPENVKVINGDTELNYIDNTLINESTGEFVSFNSQFEDMSSYVMNIDGDKYTYFSFVIFSSSDTAGAEAKSTAILTYTIDLDGYVSNVNGYTIAQ